jgi:flagellin
VNLLNGQDASTFVAGTAATAAVVTPVTAATTTQGISAFSGTATYAEAATFTITQAIDGTISSVTADTNLTNATTGQLLAVAGDNLLVNGPQTAVGAATVVGGLSITSTAPLAPSTVAAPLVTVSAASVAGTATGITAYAGALSFQVGADNSIDNQVQVNLANSYTTASLGLGGIGNDLTTQAGAQAYIDIAKGALDKLVNQRAELGATQNQVAFVQANLATSIEQTTAAVSSIRDADMAQEMADFTKNQILTQASTSMLAQANQAAQNVMTLFR